MTVATHPRSAYPFASPRHIQSNNSSDVQENEEDQKQKAKQSQNKAKDDDQRIIIQKRKRGSPLKLSLVQSLPACTGRSSTAVSLSLSHSHPLLLSLSQSRARSCIGCRGQDWCALPVPLNRLLWSARPHLSGLIDSARAAQRSVNPGSALQRDSHSSLCLLQMKSPP